MGVVGTFRVETVVSILIVVCFGIVGYGSGHVVVSVKYLMKQTVLTFQYLTKTTTCSSPSTSELWVPTQNHVWFETLQMYSFKTSPLVFLSTDCISKRWRWTKHLYVFLIIMLIIGACNILQLWFMNTVSPDGGIVKASFNEQESLHMQRLSCPCLNVCVHRAVKHRR